jgi:hypothetical protein
MSGAVAKFTQRFAFCTGLLTALVILFGGAAPAAAHGGHDHGSRRAVSQEITLLGEQDRPSQVAPESKPMFVARAHSKRLKPHPAQKQSQRSDDSGCCCGGVLCHAGALLMSDLSLVLSLHGQRSPPPTSSKRQTRLPSGLERPPRLWLV